MQRYAFRFLIFYILSFLPQVFLENTNKDIAFAIEQNNTLVSEQTIEFSSIDTIEQKIASVQDSDILTVKFDFDPFAPNVLLDYLPDGYITINGEHDVFELMLKTFFRPIAANSNIKFLLFDLNFFIQSQNQRQVINIKNLIERVAADFARKKYKTMLGLRFKYSINSQEFIDSLFNYTIIGSHIKAIWLDSGYVDFFSQKKHQSYMGQWKYLNLENNLIGAKKENFPLFLDILKKLKKLEILNLNHNAIGSDDGQLKLLSEQMTRMPKLKYVSIENNLIGAFQEDSANFHEFIQKDKTIYVNLLYNIDDPKQ